MKTKAKAWQFESAQGYQFPPVSLPFLMMAFLFD